MTFKESVRDKLIIAANEYYKLVGIDFIVVSDNFVYRNEYLLRFHKDNFLHLTGGHTKINAGEFEVNPLCWTEMFQQSYHF